MGLTMREELTILSLIFSFCILSIPLVIVNDNLDKHAVSKGKLKSDYVFGEKLLVHSVAILQSINKERDGNDSQFELSDLMEITEIKFAERFPRISFDVQCQKQPIEAWEEFDFESGTVLTSNSLLLPMKVDW